MWVLVLDSRRISKVNFRSEFHPALGVANFPFSLRDFPYRMKAKGEGRMRP